MEGVNLISLFSHTHSLSFNIYLSACVRFMLWVQNERKFMSKISHPNIVKLIGYCCEGEHRMLVYEYMKGGSLEAQLMAKDATQLHWRRRTKLALGVAKALHCLHTRGAPVIHRDLKASNVLLDDVRLCHHTF